jgi:hypothetical protein
VAPASPSRARSRRTLFLVIRWDFLRAVVERFGIAPSEVWTIENGERVSRQSGDLP